MIVLRGGVLLLLLLLGAGCGRGPEPVEAATEEAEEIARGNVTVSGDDSLIDSLSWRVPQVQVAEGDEAEALQRAATALADGRLYEDAESAIPIYLALRGREPHAKAVARGLGQSLQRLLAEGETALALADDDAQALRSAQRVAAVARVLAGDDDDVADYLQQLDQAERLWELNATGERELRAGRLGEAGGGALQMFREALQLRPAQPRAMQNLAALESAMIRRAEDAAAADDFVQAQVWLGHAGELRPGFETVADAQFRINRMRATRVSRLRDIGLAALSKFNGVTIARGHLAEMLRIADPGDPYAAELRERIDLAVHYGLYAPGQVFTDAMKGGGRGPQMVVVPHGAFTMGSPEDEVDSTDNERPRHQIRFARGFAMAIHEVSVGEFRRFVEASGHRTRASRRGFSMVYDERSGNFVRRSNVDWFSDYAGSKADDALPVLHVSARDAEAYAAWLASETGERYRLPSEAEFEYVLRAGGGGRYPWGSGAPPENMGNTTGALDRSPGGRNWKNAFGEYGDGHWGPAPVGRFQANAWGLHDLAGNVSEWVADCWHDNYRRAPGDGSAWINPGCRNQVIRGGSWASSPAHTRSAWRAPAQVDSTNAKVGFRVVRDL